jgi:hypothetical protein
MRKRTKKGLIRSLDKLFSQVIQAQAGGKCEICGKPSTQTHHWYIGKGAGGYKIRWLEDDAAAVCGGCHIKCHNSAGWCCNKLMDTWGYDEYARRENKVLTIHLYSDIKLTLTDMEEIEKELKEKLEEVSVESD